MNENSLYSQLIGIILIVSDEKMEGSLKVIKML